MGAKVSGPEEVERAVLGVLHAFFSTHRNLRWMPTRIVQSSCPGIRRRRVLDALARLTASGHVERAQERRGDPATRAYRLVRPVGPLTNAETT